MRMSELLIREPFGALLEDAMHRYCLYMNIPNTVRWIDKSPVISKRKCRGQIWNANRYTNAIFTDECESKAFEPLKREFSNSLIWWKKIFQKIYVQAAFTKKTASFLSQGTLVLEPGIKESCQTVIIPGNHKIRILNFDTNCCYSVMKQGYSSEKLLYEISCRRKAGELNLSVPKITDTNIDQMIICEEIIIGTPLNRLKKERQSTYLSSAIMSIRTLAEKTAQITTVGEYSTQLESEIELHCSALTKIDTAILEHIMSIVKKLIFEINKEPDTELAISLTHGDFQPANILCNETAAWLIDWEYCGVRQKEFDLMVFDLDARAPAGLSQRLKTKISECTCGSEKTKSSHAVYSVVKIQLFILEELLIRIYENSFGFLTRIDTGMSLFVKEIDLFMKEKYQ